MTRLLRARSEVERLLREHVTRGAKIRHVERRNDDDYEVFKEESEAWHQRTLKLLDVLFDPSVLKSYASLPGVSRRVTTPIEANLRFEWDLKDHDRRLGALRSIADDLDLAEEPPQPPGPAAAVHLPSTHPASTQPSRSVAGRRVFIVIGHDKVAHLQVVDFVRRLKLEAIVLEDEPNRGSSTIIEKLERVTGDVDYALVLLTGDDEGRKLGGATLNPRARQNVVAELGYFCAKLTRNRVTALYVEGVEIPSDFSGVLYTPLDGHGGWKQKLFKELREVWPDLDLSAAV